MDLLERAGPLGELSGALAATAAGGRDTLVLRMDYLEAVISKPATP